MNCMSHELDVSCHTCIRYEVIFVIELVLNWRCMMRGGGLGSRPIFKKFHETYAPS